MRPPALAHPWLFAVALVLLLCAEIWRRRRAPHAALPFADSAWLVALPQSWRDRAARRLPFARIALLALAALAFSDPSVRLSLFEEERRGVDLLVALDASSSMTLALPGSFASRRFDAAREAIAAFASARGSDRLGLVTFARYPRLRCPLTWDHELFALQLGEAKPVVAASEEDFTGIGVALADAAARFGSEAAPADGRVRTRVVVLVTDGANNIGPIDPMEGALLCRERAVRVYPIALGSRDTFGSGGAPPDGDLLAALATATGGRAFSAADPSALADAWREIDALERAPVVRSEGFVARSLASPLLAVAAGLWLALRLLERLALRSGPPTPAPARVLLEAASALLGVLSLVPSLAGTTASSRTTLPPCIFVLDASRSMLARDVVPDRFRAACRDLGERVRAEPGRRFGVVGFSGRAWTIAPPTADHAALLELLADVDPARVEQPGSEPAGGLERALALAGDVSGAEFVLLTDGDWDGDDPALRVAEARARGIALVARTFGGGVPAAVPDERAEAVSTSVPVQVTQAQPQRVGALVAAANAGGTGAPKKNPAHKAPLDRAGLLIALALVAAIAAHAAAGESP